MQTMRARLGPYASETALQYHLRAARGKVFWAGTIVIHNVANAMY